MQERPIILLPEPEKADRDRKTSSYIRFGKPTFDKQYDRLQPTFTVLKDAFEQKNIKIQETPIGINPEIALVFEVVGSVESFYTAVKNTEGLEWLFDKAFDGIEPDDDFYIYDENGNVSTENMDGKVYCVMTNQQAIAQLLSLWNRHKNGEDNVFQRGYAGLRDIFINIKEIRKWNANDRLSETYTIEYWREFLEIAGDNKVPFEIELFFRNDLRKRSIAAQSVTYEINNLGGKVLQESVIEGIAYHSLLVELPRKEIENLVNNYNEIELTQVDDIMFFRPTCQSAFLSNAETEKCYIEPVQDKEVSGEPVIAIFDGMPIQNHPLLSGRVILDDPDDFADGYESKYRIHGTAMTSLVLYGDLNNGEIPVRRPVYVRPILKPKEVGIDRYLECVPQDCLLLDVIHRAVIRMMEGDATGDPVAPSVKVINLSIGDPVRQLAVTMSPLARLLDYLSNKYSILFIVSAGNHPEIVSYIGKSFNELSSMDIVERNKVFFNSIRENQRNLKLLSPAENMNGLTVGALYDDFCNPLENDRMILAVSQGMPSPISAFGKGYRSIITPDLYFRGGRKYLIKDARNRLSWFLSNREPGCKVAAPFGDGVEAGQAFSFGTSDAAALLSHEAAKCYDILNQIYVSETGDSVPDSYAAILIKAMLTHGATWDNVIDDLSFPISTSERKLAKWLGNGIPNISRVEECTKNRITLIGTGVLKKEEGHVYRLPLPFDFSSKFIKRRLTVTLAYFSPIEPTKQLYRSTQMWFKIEEGSKLVPDRQNTEWQAVRKGTLQHEIFTGESPVVWNEDVVTIKVNCKEDAGKLHGALPYCLFVSFEVAEGMDIDVYSKVSTKIKQKITV